MLRNLNRESRVFPGEKGAYAGITEFCAQVSTVPMDSQHNYITDLVSYNHYFGWYCGTVADNGPWFDGLAVGTDDDHMEFPEGFYSGKDTVKDIAAIRDGNLPAGGMSYINSQLNLIPKE